MEPRRNTANKTQRRLVADISDLTPRSVRARRPSRAAPRQYSAAHVFLAVIFILLLSAASIYGGYWYRSRLTNVAPKVLVNGGDGLKTPFSYGEQPMLRQADFFKNVKEAFINDKTTFVEANLSDMKVRLYRDGVLEKEVAILTKGKEGSWWETPAGLYEIQSKSENHFSSFGHVYTPWNMAFQGNFFIHGWPTYPNGTPVESTYSGGCIRLSDADAKALYDLTPAHTPVLVYEEDYGSDGFVYSIVAPDVTADEYAVLDIKSGAILTQTNMDAVRPIASVTKLATALVAAEYINLDGDIVIPAEAVASTSVPRLKAGDTVTAYSLLFPLLLESSNEAAEAFAQRLGRDRFVTLMNEKIASLGMKDTRFVDPTGDDFGNLSSVTDLLRLAQYLYNNRSFILKISSGQDVPTLYRITTFENLQNFNEVPEVDGFKGGSVGKNSVGETALLFFSISVGGEKRDVAIVLLDSEDRAADAKALLSHIERTYSGMGKEGS